MNEVPKKPGWFSRLTEGLSRSSKQMSEQLVSTIVKRPLDQAMLDDLEEMLMAGRCDVAYVTGILTEFLGADDERIASLLALRDEVQNAQDSSG